MGDIAEAMLDGTLCEGCGVFLGESSGYPQRCRQCADDLHVSGIERPQRSPDKVNCPVCRKRVKQVGLHDHMRDVHATVD